MNESASHDDSGVLELFGLSGFSVGRSSHVKQNHQGFIAIAALPASEGCPVVVLFDPVLQEIRKDMLKEVRSMLCIDVRNVLEDTIKVT